MNRVVLYNSTGIIMLIFLFLLSGFYGVANKNDLGNPSEARIHFTSNSPYLEITINPNPTHGLLKVKIWGLYSTKNLPSQLKIYGLFGDEVADLTTIFNQNNNGSWSEFETFIQFPVSGMYMMILRAGKFVATEKFLVVK